MDRKNCTARFVNRHNVTFPFNQFVTDEMFQRIYSYHSKNLNLSDFYDAPYAQSYSCKTALKSICELLTYTRMDTDACQRRQCASSDAKHMRFLDSLVVLPYTFSCDLTQLQLE